MWNIILNISCKISYTLLCRSNALDLVQMNQFQEKCLLIDFNGSMFVSMFPHQMFLS